MASNIMFRALCHVEKQLCSQCVKMRNPYSHFRRPYSIYEPDYLEIGKSEIPLYPVLNIQLKGYDFPVLESYQSLVNKIAESLDAEVENGWAVPCQKLQVQKYKPQSTVVDSEYHLNIYERNVQVSGANSMNLSILLQALTAALPEGVTLQVHEHLPEHEELRYIPDHDLIALKTELETLTGGKTTDTKRR